VLVHAAGDHESQWALHALKPVEIWTDRVETVFADSAYEGLGNEIENKLDWSLSVVEPEGEKSGFSVDPKRWIIERTFSWLGGWRRLNRDYERHTDSSSHHGLAGIGVSFIVPAQPAPAAEPAEGPLDNPALRVD
jgi:putative transposase